MIKTLHGKSRPIDARVSVVLVATIASPFLFLAPMLPGLLLPAMVQMHSSLADKSTNGNWCRRTWAGFWRVLTLGPAKQQERQVLR